MAKQNKLHIRALAAPFLAVTLLFGLTATVSSGDVAQVKNIELIYNDGGVIVRVHTGAKNEFTHQIEPSKNGKPYRIILDCLDADHSLGGNTFNTLPASVIDNIRTSQFTVSPRHICRVVLDLKKEAFYRVSQSEKYIDLYVTDRDAKRFGPWSTASWLASQQESNSSSSQPKSNPSTVASKPTESQQQSASAQKSVAVSASTPKSEKVQSKLSTDLTLTQDQLDAALSAIQPQKSLTQNPETKTQTASAQKPAEKAPAVSSPATTVAKQVEQPKQAAVENSQKVSQPVESKTVATQKPVVTPDAKFDSKSTDNSASTAAQPKSATSGPLAEAASTKTITQPATSKPSAQSVDGSKSVASKAVTEKSASAKPAETKPEVAKSTVKSSDSSPAQSQSGAPNQKTASKQVTNEKQNSPATTNSVAQQSVPKPTSLSTQKSNPVLEGSTKANPTATSASASKPTVSNKPVQSATATQTETPVVPAPKQSTVANTVTKSTQTKSSEQTESTAKSEVNTVEPKKSGSSLFASNAQAAEEAQAAPQPEADDGRGYSATFRRAVRDKEEIKLKGTQVAEFPKRLTIQYKSQGDRDPFKSLFIEEKRDSNDPLQPSLPNVEYLTMVGILRDVNGGMRGLFEDIDGRGYILAAGDKVKNGTVLKITSENAYFQIFEYGWSRTTKLELDGQ